MMIEKYIKKTRMISNLLTWLNIYMAVLFFLFYMDINLIVKAAVNLCMFVGYFVSYRCTKKKQRRFDDTLVMKPVFFLFGAAALILSTFYNEGICAIAERILGIIMIAGFLYNMYLSSYVNYLSETNSFEASNINRSFKNHNINYILWLFMFVLISLISLFLPYKAMGNMILDGMRLVFGYLFRNKKQKGGSVSYESVEEEAKEFTAISDGENVSSFWLVVLLIFVSVLILMLYLAVKKIKEYKADGKTDECEMVNIPEYETIEDIPHGINRREKIGFSDSVEGKVRRSFVKTVRSIYGKNVDESNTPDELVGKFDKNGILRKTYEKVRYSSNKITEPEAEMAHDAAKHIRRRFKKNKSKKSAAETV